MKLNEDLEIEQTPPVEVQCRIIFARMGSIDTIKERFECQAFVECIWNDDKLLQKILQEANITTELEVELSEYLRTFKFDPLNHWTPRIYFDNAINDGKQERAYKVAIFHNKDTNLLTLRVFEQIFVKGVFYEVCKNRGFFCLFFKTRF